MRRGPRWCAAHLALELLDDAGDHPHDLLDLLRFRHGGRGSSAEAFRLLCALALRLTVVGERDSPTQVDLGATLNMSVRSVRRNLLVLEQAGVVRCGKEGRRRTYTLVYQSPHVHATPDTAVPYSYDPLVPEATPLPAVNRLSLIHI